MLYKIVTESKAWNKANIINDQIHVLWSEEKCFEILEYQICDEINQIVFHSENEDDVIAWLKTNDDK